MTYPERPEAFTLIPMCKKFRLSLAFILKNLLPYFLKFYTGNVSRKSRT